jgi:N-acetylneuraminate synthase
MIQGLKQTFPNKVIGYSDHTLPDESMTSLTVAYLLGAVIIEKHFTDNKNLPGNDHYHAMDVNDLKKFTHSASLIKDLMGPKASKNYIQTEIISRENARRSIVLSRACQKGEVISESNITYKRPGSGISPILWDEVIGGVLLKDLNEDHILQWCDFQKSNG